MVVAIIRELCKLIMFIVLWGLPLLISYWNKNNYYLFLLICSGVFTILLFHHYETLEESDNYINDNNNE